MDQNLLGHEAIAFTKLAWAFKSISILLMRLVKKRLADQCDIVNPIWEEILVLCSICSRCDLPRSK
jgi:hypothetical protein